MTAADAPPAGRRGFLIGLFAIALVATVLRLVVLHQFERDHPLAGAPAIDEASYDRWAREIAGGEWLGDEVFFQEPLYPYLLGCVYALGDDATRLARVRRVQVALGVLGVALVGLLGRRLFGDAAGLFAAAALALHRPALLAPCLLLKVNPMLVVMPGLGLLLAYGRAQAFPARGAFALGLVAGLGALLRGNLLILLPFFVLLPCIGARAWRWRLSSAALVALGAASALLPVAIRNQAVGGVFALTTSGAGTNFYGGNNADNPFGVATEFDWVRTIPEHEPGDWRREAERRSGRALDPGEVSSFWLGEALASMRADPGLHASILWNKLRLVLSSYEVPDNHFLEWDARFLSLLRWPLGGFGVWGALGVAGLLVFAFRRSPRDALDVAAFVVLYAGTIVVTVMSMRARLAIVPLLVVFGGSLVVFATDALRRRSGRALAGAGLAIAVAALFAADPVMPAAERESDFYERDYNCARHFLDRGDLDAASELTEKLVARYPGTVRVELLKVEIDLRSGLDLVEGSDSTAADRRDGATRITGALDRLAAFDRDSANAADLYRIDLWCGAVLRIQGRWESAARFLRAALAFDDSDRQLRRWLANCVANAAAEGPESDRDAGLREAIGLYDALLAEEHDLELVRLRDQVRAVLAGE